MPEADLNQIKDLVAMRRPGRDTLRHIGVASKAEPVLSCWLFKKLRRL
jgi:hypothetical protein